MNIPLTFSYPVQHGNFTWFHMTDTGPELGKDFSTWEQVKAAMIKEGIIYFHNNIGIFTLVCCKALEEKR